MGTAVVLLSVSVLSAVGLGSALAWLLRINPNAGERGLLGLLGSGILAATLHFFIPISTTVRLVFLVGGVVCLVVFRTRLGSLSTLGYALLAFACVYVHPNALPLFDNGLYHLQSIRWNTDSALTVGLVNLHERLAFNSILFLIAPIYAMSTLGWVTNCLVAGFVILASFDRLCALANNKVHHLPFWFLLVSIGIFTFQAPWMGWLGVLNADGILSALVVYWVFLLLEYYQGTRSSTVPNLLLLFAVLAVLIKLSGIPILLCTALFLALRRAPLLSKRVLAACAIAAVIWLTRGYLQSGCAFFPISQSCVFSLPWAAARNQAEHYSIGIRSWARMPGELDYKSVVADWRWFRPWWENSKDKDPFPLLRWALPIGLAALLYRMLRGKGIDYGFVWAVTALVGSTAWWFWAAPDPRFGQGCLVSLGMLCLALAASAVFVWPKVHVRLVPFVLTVVAVWTVQAGYTGSWKNRENIVSSIIYRNILQTAPGGSWRTLPDLSAIDVNQVIGPGGIRIWVPIQGYQCWDHPLPCTPYVNQKAFQKVIWRWPLATAESSGGLHK